MKYLHIFLFLLSSLLHGSVEHKHDYIDFYLSNISKNMSEKTQLLEYIQKNTNGTFIDIGTGGDAIAEMVLQLPKTVRPTLIAADIDPLVINSIPIRRPIVKSYINSLAGPKIELATMSATDMKQIRDSTISGVGASALAHEVFSYVMNKGPLDQFVTEICRVLEKEGVFIYRDPKWVDDPWTQCTMIFKKDMAKYYATLFLTKFFDRKFSLLRDYRNECSKPLIYDFSKIKFNLYLQDNNTQCKQMSLDEFLQTPSPHIDYSKNFSIEAPKGLIAEIQRHYLMYLSNYFSSGFVEDYHFKDDLNLNNLSKEEREVLSVFIEKKSIPLNDHILEKKYFPILFKEAHILKSAFLQGFRIPFSTELHPYIKKLYSEGIDRNMLYLTDNEVVIDPKYLVLLFHGQNKGIFEFLTNGDQLPFDLLEHLKLEGEEHYFYKTTDELITYMGQFSHFILKDSHKKHYLLAPIDREHIKEAPRNFYKSFLKREFLVLDLLGNLQEPVVEKNIIHFQLQSVERSMEVYHTLLNSDSDKYPELKKWITRNSL